MWPTGQEGCQSFRPQATAGSTNTMADSDRASFAARLSCPMISTTDSISTVSDDAVLPHSANPPTQCKASRTMPERQQSPQAVALDVLGSPPALKCLAAEPIQKQPLKGALCVELCAGSAGLSAALRSCGFSICAIDCSSDRHRAQTTILQADLCTVAGRQLAAQVLASPSLHFCHAAPPCGAASRARERPLKAREAALLRARPKPLRSARFPDGLPNLSARDAERVAKANMIYRFVAEQATKLHSQGILVCIENPLRSRMWETKHVRALFAVGFNIVELHHCMVGGKRLKKTGLLCNHVCFKQLRLLCDGGHTHLPWGAALQGDQAVFATSLETAYPPEMCRAISQVVLDQAISKGFHQQDTVAPHVAASVATNKQPRRGPPQLIPEYARTTTVPVNPSLPTLVPGHKITRMYNGVPAGSKVLAIRSIGGGWAGPCATAGCRVRRVPHARRVAGQGIGGGAPFHTRGRA